MRNIVSFTFAAVLLITSLSFGQPKLIKVNIKTNKGDILLSLNETKAPKTVENFLNYVNSGFYEGTIFHRVIKGFMIQGGGLTADLSRKKTNPSIINEADNGYTNRPGTIAMARRGDPNSATSQFFINTGDNQSLNFKSKSAQGWGYCVFGRVISGMEIVKQIEATKTGSKNGYRDVPLETIIIEKVTVVKE